LPCAAAQEDETATPDFDETVDLFADTRDPFEGADERSFERSELDAAEGSGAEGSPGAEGEADPADASARKTPGAAFAALLGAVAAVALLVQRP
jgi:hypothetical protein